MCYGLHNYIFERKIVNNFLSTSFKICYGAEKNSLIKTIPTIYVSVEK